MLQRSTLTDIKNKIVTALISNKELVRALVIDNKDFLDCTPSEEQQKIIDNPSLLVRTQIFPYKKIFDITVETTTYITMSFSEFFKDHSGYRGGKISLFILTPILSESTDYGMRYDWIADKIEEIFPKSNIGDLDCSYREDIEVDNTTYVCHCMDLNVVDFYMTDK